MNVLLHLLIITLLLGVTSSDCGYDTCGLQGSVPLYTCSLNLCTQLTSLDLHSSRAVYGTIPANIGSMRWLTVSLSFSGLQLSGSIPASMGSLTNLNDTLSIDKVGTLTGSIPASFGSLTSLRKKCALGYLDGLTGTIPASLGSLINLETSFGLVALGSLSGTIPASLGSLIKLDSKFELYKLGSVTGTIPASLGSLTKLDIGFALVELGSLAGTIPDSLGSLINLKNFFVLEDLGSLTGTIPASLGSLINLQSDFELIELGSLTSTIPASLGSLQNLESIFALKGMDLSGNIPSSLSHLKQIGNTFQFKDLELQGTLPAWLCSLQLKTARDWDLSSNAFHGPVTYTIGARSPSLNSLDLSHNAFSGNFTITTLFGGYNAMELTALALAHNQFTTIDLAHSTTSFFVDMSKLQVVDINNNPLTPGGLPEHLSAATNLERLDMSFCQASGALPESWAELTSLVSLNLAGNNLTGTIPTYVGLLSSLTTLDLSSNQLQPTMPASLCSLDVQNMTTCSLTQRSTIAGGGDWDCSALLTSCAQLLDEYCEAGQNCIDTSHVYPESTFLAVVVAVVVFMLATAAAILWIRAKRRARNQTLLKQTKHRAATMELLQGFLGEDEDVGTVLLPADCVDLSSNSPCIASGSGGRVYRCTLTLAATIRTVINETVALKELYAMQDLVNVKAGVAEFAKELTVLMQLQHKHIVTFYGMYQYFDDRAGEMTDRYFLVTQFAEHGSLDAYIEADMVTGPTPTRRLAWAREIALAVQYLHRESFVHRDIKPQNVLLHGQDWHCLLTDFGIARSVDSSTKALTSRIGTAQYMPPEALSGLADGNEESASAASKVFAKHWDVYSFGCLLAAMFNCQLVPYPDLDERVVMVKVLLGDLRPVCPAMFGTTLRELVHQMWAQDPIDRPSFDAVLDEIDHATAEGAFVPNIAP